MARSRPVRDHRTAEDGYTLLAVVFLMAAVALALSVAAPVVSRQIQRDRERETMERGKQYIRAIQLYYRKFHAYPPSIDALIETNNIRFLRKRYVDPMTGHDDWQPVLFGQNKAPTAIGFFGQSLSRTTLAGTGPSGGNTLASASALGSATDSSSKIAMGTSSVSTFASGSSGGSVFDNLDSNKGFSSGTGVAPSGQAFGGAGIIGVEPTSSRQSIIVYKNKDRYNEWEFTYDPLNDMTLVSRNAQAEHPSGASLVGSGMGSDGTGPTTAPISAPTGTSAEVQ